MNKKEINEMLKLRSRRSETFIDYLENDPNGKALNESIKALAKK